MQSSIRNDACIPESMAHMLRAGEDSEEACLPCGIPIESLRVIIKALRRMKPGTRETVSPDEVDAPRASVNPVTAEGAACLRKPLSPREQQILELLVQGATDKEVADALGLSRSTVQSHVGAIHQKTGALNRVHLGVAAVQLGLVAIDGPPSQVA